MKEITVEQLRLKVENKEDFQLIDVREPFEREIASIEGANIPLAQISMRINEIELHKDVVVYCRSGKRSATAINQIKEHYKNAQLYNLKGGILEWADKIDSTITKY
ncbi:MAG: rhodanese-related sulfurtransferase [Parvicella sp.]|jgi:rhodanese-related sulfurtransferase